MLLHFRFIEYRTRIFLLSDITTLGSDLNCMIDNPAIRMVAELVEATTIGLFQQ